MATTQIKISHFCWNNQQKATNYPLIYPIKAQAKFKKFGDIYILANFSSYQPIKKEQKEFSKKFVEKLASYIEDNYYNPLLANQSIQNNFENLIGQINEWLKRESLRDENNWVERIKLNLVLIKEQEIYCSWFGNFVFLSISGDKVEIIEPEKKQENKFVNLISGKIEKGDILFFTLSYLFDYFTEKRITNLLKKNSLNEDSLGKLNFNLVGLILKSEEQDQKQEINQEIEENKQEKEEKIQSKTRAKRKGSEKTEEERIEEIFRPQTYEFEQGKSPSIKANVSSQKSSKNLREFFPLTKWQKFIIVSVVLVLLLLVQNIIISRKNAQLQKEQALIDDFTAEFRTKKQQLDSAQEKEKISLLEDLKNILESFPKNSKTAEEVFNNLNQEWLTYLEENYQYHYLPELSAIFDLNTLGSPFNPTNLITKDENSFYLVNKQTNTLYQINLKLNQGEAITSFKNIPEIKKIISLDKDNILLVDKQNGISRFNLKTNSLTPLKIEKSEENQEISNIAYYGGRIYILDKTQNQIFRYPETIAGFANGAKWLKENQACNFTNVVNFAIDGSIYLAKSNGLISKFYLGEEQTFNFENIFPLITELNFFSTSPETKYLYLAENKTNRVIIYDKEGNLIKQISSPVLDDIKDIKQKQENILVLNGTRIFSFPLEKK